MKWMKLFENWEKINEEWFPQCPYMSLKKEYTNSPDPDIAEFYELDDEGENWGIKFIGGKGDHFENIKDILNALKDIHYVTDKFNCHSGVDDCKITQFIIYRDNLNGISISKVIEEMKKWGEVNDESGYIQVILKQPFIIDVPESNEKSKSRFNNKLNKLFDLLENGTIDFSEENSDLVDKLISKFRK